MKETWGSPDERVQGAPGGVARRVLEGGVALVGRLAWVEYVLEPRPNPGYR